MVENTLVPPAERVNAPERLQGFLVMLSSMREGSFSEKFWHNWGGSPNVQQMRRALGEITGGFWAGMGLVGGCSEGAWKQIYEAQVDALY
jgi:hypothetical protein